MNDIGVQVFCKCIYSNFAYFIGLHSSLLYATYVVVTNMLQSVSQHIENIFLFILLNTRYVGKCV
jgi:hypothetical protein